MNSNERPTIEDVIWSWKAKYGVKAISQGGTPYLKMDKKSLLENLIMFIETLISLGYSYDEINATHVPVKIADICWPEEIIIRMSTAEIKKAKKKIAHDWKLALTNFRDIEFAKRKELNNAIAEPSVLIKKEKNVPEKEEKIDLEPKDRIKMDTSDIPDAPINTDIIAELAAIGTDVSGLTK